MEMHMDEHPSIPIPICGAPKRKHAEPDELDAFQLGIEELADHCRKSVAPRTESRLQGGTEQAQFYPLPPELNRAVLASLDYAARPSTPPRAPEVEPLAPNDLSCGHDTEMVEEETQSRKHAEQCTSMPLLSVRHYCGTASQLWSHCPDCGTFSKVQASTPVLLCYSP
ncbi:hypothetical protein MVES_001297 [Malassezia vespertilionis]|uniref:Uncharacterized protein n=1 Tax=Malassezia vespertilionis TaxID=2020962 RepID=A0A2N1JE57_9BASI|nr:hypothetical protein MVES_001297 [Malassezia vespertilionis]